VRDKDRHWQSLGKLLGPVEQHGCAENSEDKDDIEHVNLENGKPQGLVERARNLPVSFL